MAEQAGGRRDDADEVPSVPVVPVVSVVPGPVPSDGPPRPPVPPGAYWSYSTYVPPPRPAPARRSSTKTWLVVLVLVVVGIVVLGGIVGGAHLVQQARENDRVAELERRRSEADADRTAADRFEAAPKARVPVHAGGGLSWTMRADPVVEPMSMPDANGTPIDATLWMADVQGGAEADLAAIFDLDGRSYDLDDGLRGIVSESNGTALHEFGPVEIAGVGGRMVVVRLDGEFQAIARYAIIQVDDRALVVASVIRGLDEAAGEQSFADLVASVRYR